MPKNGSLVIVRHIEPKKALKFADAIYKNFIELKQYPELNHNKKEIIRLLTSNKSKVIFIMVNNKIGAYIVGELIDLQDGRKVFYVNYLYTSKQFRKRGFASRLMNYIEEMTKQFKYDGIMLTCDTKNEKVFNFYATRGYFMDLFLRRHNKHDILYKSL